MSILQGLFSRPMFTGDKQTQQRKAAEGLSQVFATILARQMRGAASGGEQGPGPLGIGGGASGSIYGSFMDDAMSKLLAHSPAMQQLNRSLEHQLAGPHATAPTTSAGKIRALEKIDHVIFTAAIRDETAVPITHAPGPMFPAATLEGTSADALGPRLLPPPPNGMAPNLPPPLPLEG